jgi:hypothetical protein
MELIRGLRCRVEAQISHFPNFSQAITDKNMADGPKVIEDKYNRILIAWKTLAPDKIFGGITLEQFEAQIERSNAPRKRLNRLDNEIKLEQTNRDSEDISTLKVCETIVKNVLADPDFGDDSGIYEAMGYIRKSNRKSGLTRRKTIVEPETP